MGDVIVCGEESAAGFLFGLSGEATAVFTFDGATVFFVRGVAIIVAILVSLSLPKEL